MHACGMRILSFQERRILVASGGTCPCPARICRALVWRHARRTTTTTSPRPAAQAMTTRAKVRHTRECSLSSNPSSRFGTEEQLQERRGEKKSRRKQMAGTGQYLKDRTSRGQGHCRRAKLTRDKKKATNRFPVTSAPATRSSSRAAPRRRRRRRRAPVDLIGFSFSLWVLVSHDAAGLPLASSSFAGPHQ
jgi:hypothetical protein